MYYYLSSFSFVLLYVHFFIPLNSRYVESIQWEKWGLIFQLTGVYPDSKAMLSPLLENEVNTASINWALTVASTIAIMTKDLWVWMKCQHHRGRCVLCCYNILNYHLTKKYTMLLLLLLLLHAILVRIISCNWSYKKSYKKRQPCQQQTWFLHPMTWRRQLCWLETRINWIHGMKKVNNILLRLMETKESS